VNAMAKIGMKLDKVKRAEAALAKLNAEGAAVADEIMSLQAREDDIEDPAEMASMMAATRAARNRLRKLDAKIADARQRLATVTAERREALRVDLVAAFMPAALDFLARAQAARGAFSRLMASREAILSAGFESDYRSLPIPPAIGNAPLLAVDLLSQFEDGLRPVQRPNVDRRQSLCILNGNYDHPTLGTFQQGDTVAMTPEQGVPYVASGRAAWVQEEQDPGSSAVSPSAVDLPPPPIPPRAKRPPLREIAGEGERLFHVLRGRLEHPRKGQMQAGDVVAMTFDEAEPLIRNGAGDWISDEEISRIDAAAGPGPTKETVE